MVRRPFFIARCEPPPLLEPVDQPFHPVAFPVDRPVERPCALLVPLMRDRDPDAVPSQIRPDLAAAGAFVAHEPLWAEPRTPATQPFDRPLLHQLLKGGRFVPFTGRQHERYGLAMALGADMDLGAEPTLTATQGFRRWVPLFAPAACWWARMTVAST